MDYYIDIRVLPDPEFKEAVLMSALFAKLHRGLAQLDGGGVGVSFPRHKTTLGPLLRLHGNNNQLSVLMALPWLKGLRDYTRVSEPQQVPDNAVYRVVQRIQKKSAYNKSKRAIKKGWLTEEQAIEKFGLQSTPRLGLPFVTVKSLSTQSQVKIFIAHGDLQQQPVAGTFGSYGLSKTATIPWF